MADNVAEESAGLPALAVTAAVGAVVLLLVLLCGVGQGKGQQEEEKTAEEKNSKVKKQPRKAKPKPAPKQRPGTHTFSHTLLSTSLKGHSGRVMGLDFSNNAKYLATCAEDRTVRIWSLKDWKDKEHKSVQVNVELDHATSVKFSPDNRAFIVALYNGNTIRVFRIGRKDEGTGIHVSALEQDFPQKSIKDIVGLGISSNGKFMMTAFADTSIYVWNTKPGGEVLATIDTHQMENYHAAVSPCGRFIGCSGFTPDVKVWEVSFTKGGEFNQVSRAFELKGHSSGVYSFDFNVDSSRMVSVSKDGTWRLWDTNIEYQKGQEASLLSKGDLHSSAHCMVAMAPNGSSFAIAQGYDISLYSTESGQEEEKFTDVHAEPVTAVAFDLGSKYLVSAGDKHVRVLHNTVGYRALLHDLQHKLKTTQSTAYKERLKEQIKETEDALKSIVGEEKGEKDKKDKENSKKKGK
ncbi:transducin beta-like protein 2 isoform X1 [Branchiostoma floridae]|uniref:Transducin beta-like protein 2 isoform X1 n=1 Tax=Branchiostoma floridae TaxID=7739 RepID=A0A9J7M0C6_BRAFL|nr:transducin beta-like protein 2 isoform X1 [Branchiostoma floridae]